MLCRVQMCHWSASEGPALFSLLLACVLRFPVQLWKLQQYFYHFAVSRTPFKVSIFWCCTCITWKLETLVLCVKPSWWKLVQMGIFKRKPVSPMKGFYCDHCSCRHAKGFLYQMLPLNLLWDLSKDRPFREEQLLCSSASSCYRLPWVELSTNEIRDCLAQHLVSRASGDRCVGQSMGTWCSNISFMWQLWVPHGSASAVCSAPSSQALPPLWAVRESYGWIAVL